VTKPRKIAAGIGAAALVCAVLALGTSGAPRALAAWTAVACTIACLAYLLNRPHWLGKRAGVVSPRALPVWPYLVAFRVACLAMARWRGPDEPTRVAPGLWVGGRSTMANLPPEVTVVVDLVAEYAADREIRALPGYRSLPVLDGGVPGDVEAFAELVGEVAMAAAREVLVHCDSGRGRAPTFAAAVLIVRGQAADPAEAVAMLRARRPVVAPTRSDLLFLAAAMPRLRALAARAALVVGDAGTAPVDREQLVG